MESSEQTQHLNQASEPIENNNGPLFNIYHTEVVKFDATNSIQMANGDLVKRSLSSSSLSSPSHQVDHIALNSGDAADQTSDEQFALLKSDYKLAEQAIKSDSINNKSFTDVTFIVGPPQHSKKYVGHRVLLAMTSPVFETMFYGDMADKSKYIRIVDVAPIGFENLLRYAYTDSLNLNSVEDAMLTAYAAKKYLLPQLLRECLTYIEHNIGPSSACVVFEFAHVLNSQQLILQAMNLIDRQTMSVINSKSFTSIQGATVEFVANRKYLNLTTEFSLFNSVIAWAQAEARRRSIGPNDWLSIRSILAEHNSILKALRFMAMTQEEFARAIAQTSGTCRVPSSSTLMSVSINHEDDDTLQAKASNTNTNSGGDILDNDGDSELDERERATNKTMHDLSSATGGVGGAGENDESTTGGNRARRFFVQKINCDDPNSLLDTTEQRAIFLNLNLNDVARLPDSVCPVTQTRQAPPEYFTLKRFGGQRSTTSSLAITTTTTRSIKAITSKFQCLSENVFIVGLTIPIRLDVSSYANRTPKFECHLKFTTKTTGSSAGDNDIATQKGPQQQQQQRDDSPMGSMIPSAGVGGTTLLMDTIDESLNISISRDRDCLVRLKRPILIRCGNLNELTLTFQTYALDEDIVALRAPKLRAANFSEQTDSENISWLFFKTSGIEFSELHYYY